MSALQESFIAGLMVSGLTFGTLKIVLMNFKEEI